ncbi:type II toxin-antitoxin system VapB family antitoxin [Inquilinus sp. NPDC058860]|uniref:type II toxin-antitoxin system VapB family antitoxin n=1 Tax=Inquilinus sp. NPDC058860 TaxID=3346652 RepID=UPI003677BA51
MASPDEAWPSSGRRRWIISPSARDDGTVGSEGRDFLWGLGVIRTRLFTSRRGQVVCLPKAVAFPEGTDQVEILKIGDSRLITPVGRRWDCFFLQGPRASEDFFEVRVQPKAEERGPSDDVD